jgi:antitoxin HicB
MLLLPALIGGTLLAIVGVLAARRERKTARRFKSDVEYPVHLEWDDNETWLVSFPDFPEAHTTGRDEADALAHAVDALATVVDAYLKDRLPIPPPSDVPGAPRVRLPVVIEEKVQADRVDRAVQEFRTERRTR